MEDLSKKIREHLYFYSLPYPTLILDFEHVSLILQKIEKQFEEKIEGGSFVDAVCKGNWAMAIDCADLTNIKYLKVYKDFCEFYYNPYGIY